MTIRGTVKCDDEACCWQQDDVIVAEWMERDCPSCGKPLMDEVDKAAFGLLALAEAAGLVTQGTGEGITLRIDTQQLKGKQL